MTFPGWDCINLKPFQTSQRSLTTMLCPFTATQNSWMLDVVFHKMTLADGQLYLIMPVCKWWGTCQISHTCKYASLSELPISKRDELLIIWWKKSFAVMSGFYGGQLELNRKAAHLAAQTWDDSPKDIVYILMQRHPKSFSHQVTFFHNILGHLCDCLHISLQTFQFVLGQSEHAWALVRLVSKWD